MSGAFVLAEETEGIEVPCPCPGTPHEVDTVTVKSRFSGGDVALIDVSMYEVLDSASGTARIDLSGAQRKMMEVGVLGWTFTNGTNDAVPFDPALVNRLDAPIWTVVADRLSEKLTAARRPFEKRPSRPSNARRKRR